LRFRGFCKFAPFGKLPGVVSQVFVCVVPAHPVGFLLLTNSEYINITQILIAETPELPCLAKQILWTTLKESPYTTH
jgi:hypothetical protein